MHQTNLVVPQPDLLIAQPLVNLSHTSPLKDVKAETKIQLSLPDNDTSKSNFDFGGLLEKEHSLWEDDSD